MSRYSTVTFDNNRYSVPYKYVGKSTTVKAYPNYIEVFRLNGFINHYPDFIVAFKSGKIALIETKGDHLGNEDSKRKLELGRQWQSLAGPQYRYFMVFNENKLPGKGSYTLSEIIGVLKEL